MSQVANKVVQIIARVQIKKNGIVIYKVRSSNGIDIYDVTVVRSKVNNCTCASRKPCYHMRGIQERENARSEEIAAQAEQANMKKLAAHRIGSFYEDRAAQMHRHCERCNAVQGTDPEVELTQCSVCKRTICTLCVLSDSDEPVRCVECEKDYQRGLYAYYEMSLGII